MLDIMKKTLLAGIGATVITVEKLDQMLNTLVERGKLTLEEAREFRDKVIEESRKEYDDAREGMEHWFEEMISKAGLVRKSRFDEVNKRMDEIEAELEKLRSAQS